MNPSTPVLIRMPNSCCRKPSLALSLRIASQCDTALPTLAASGLIITLPSLQAKRRASPSPLQGEKTWQAPRYATDHWSQLLRCPSCSVRIEKEGRAPRPPSRLPIMHPASKERRPETTFSTPPPPTIWTLDAPLIRHVRACACGWAEGIMTMLIADGCGSTLASQCYGVGTAGMRTDRCQ